MRFNIRAFVFVALLAALIGGALALPREDEITFETSQECYALGDTVYFTLNNGSDSTLTFYYLPPWSIWDVGPDTLIYPQNVYWVITYLGPDSSVTWWWDQLDYNLNPVGAGQYWVEVNFGIGGGAMTTLADTFSIGGQSVTSQASWGAIKSRYR